MDKEKIMETNLNESARIEWVEKQLKKLQPESVLLDAGAGEQQYKKFCSHLQYVSQDFAAYKPAPNDSGLQMQGWDYGKLDIVSDITKIPRDDQSFDAILCTEVFEHIPDPLAALKEFSRLLKTGGTLILTAPFCSMTHFAPFHYYTGFSKYFYQHHLKEKGFEIVEINSNGNYFSYIEQELNRTPFITEQYSTQKISLLEMQAIKLVSKLLKRLKTADKGSDELMCFGLHVVAVKK